MDKKIAKRGDKICCNGITVEIDIIFSQDYYPHDGWDVEFDDTTGEYRRWKQYQDGGELIPKK